MSKRRGVSYWAGFADLTIMHQAGIILDSCVQTGRDQTLISFKKKGFKATLLTLLLVFFGKKNFNGL